MKKSKEEILDSLRVVLGENTSDEVLTLIEDLTDTLTLQAIDWEAKYNENDASWRQRYRDRFFGKPVEDPDPEPEVVDPEPAKTFDDLFTKED